MRTRVLLVEPDASEVASLREAMDSFAQIDSCTTFGAARGRIMGKKYDRLVTNLRLQIYNGLHLVYLAGPITRSVVYTDRQDVSLAREVQSTGAFYEWNERLRRAFAGYVQGGLPPLDRRDPCGGDRRIVHRGGRRRCDIPTERIVRIARERCYPRFDS